MPKPKSDDPRNVSRTIRFTQSESERIDEMIPAGQSFSTYVRKLLLKRGR